MNECKIVQDLLPLYAEELVSGETRNFVENHCAGCESCKKMHQRSVSDIPTAPEDPKAYKKALRKNQFNLICKATLLFLMVLGVLVYGCEKLDSYMKWKEGEAPVEAVIEAPVGNGKVTLVDWDASGQSYGVHDQRGTLIRYSQMDVRQDEYGTGYSINEGTYAKHWENVRVFWSPDGVNFLMTAQLLDGSDVIFLEEYKQWYGEKGQHYSTSKLLPKGYEHGYVDVLTAHCRELEDFPTGWETITVTFLTWKEDCETLVFVYETDNGHRGVLDYHFPSDTITKVN